MNEELKLKDFLQLYNVATSYAPKTKSLDDLLEIIYDAYPELDQKSNKLPSELTEKTLTQAEIWEANNFNLR